MPTGLCPPLLFVMPAVVAEFHRKNPLLLRPLVNPRLGPRVMGSLSRTDDTAANGFSQLLLQRFITHDNRPRDILIVDELLNSWSNCYRENPNAFTRTIVRYEKGFYRGLHTLQARDPRIPGPAPSMSVVLIVIF